MSEKSGDMYFLLFSIWDQVASRKSPPRSTCLSPIGALTGEGRAFLGGSSDRLHLLLPFSIFSRRLPICPNSPSKKKLRVRSRSRSLAYCLFYSLVCLSNELLIRFCSLMLQYFDRSDENSVNSSITSGDFADS